MARREVFTRFWLLYLGLAAVLVVLLGRSFYLQVWAGSGFLTRAEGNRLAIEPQVAPRGLLLDRYSKKLVENIPSTDVVLDPALLPRGQEETILFDRLPNLLGLSAEVIQQTVQFTRDRQRLTVLKKAVPHDMLLKLEEERRSLPGVRLISSLVRNYPFGMAAAHVLGYTSAVTADDLAHDDNLLSVDQTGKVGLEKQYDAALRGKPGAIYTQVNAQGEPLLTMGTKAAESGHNLSLTLDIELQQFIYEQLKDRVGAVVVIEPATGAVRALANMPTFDPNVFSQPARQHQLSTELQRHDNPLFNRAVGGMYPPGSTIKPFLAAAALEEHIITPETIILSTGGITVGPWHFPDWKTGGHGPTTVTKALAESVNTFFYAVSGGYEHQAGLGVEKIITYLQRFGWGEPSGIDLPGEATGFLPSPAWKEKTKQEPWYIGDTYHLGIGQGDVLVTPLQVSVATSVIANQIQPNGQGWRPQPHLIATNQATGEQLSLRGLATVRDGMRAAVTQGSARALADLPITLAGKTGTAQVGGDTETTHAWFTSFGPVEQPRYVVTVLLEKGGAGDRDAVPVAKAIWKWLLEHDRL